MTCSFWLPDFPNQLLLSRLSGERADFILDTVVGHVQSFLYACVSRTQSQRKPSIN